MRCVRSGADQAWWRRGCRPLARRPAHAASLNLLENPSFEGDFEIHCSFPGGKPWIAVPCNGPLPSRPWQTVQMAKGWSAWWQPPNEDRSGQRFLRRLSPIIAANWRPMIVWPGTCRSTATRAARRKIRRAFAAAQNSQKYFTFWSVHEGGVYQVVEGVRPGMAAALQHLHAGLVGDQVERRGTESAFFVRADRHAHEDRDRSDGRH